MHSGLAAHGMHYACLRVDGFDPDALLGVVNETRFEQRLLVGGHFRARAQRIVFPDFSLDCGTYTLPVFANGSFGSDVVGLALAMRCNEPMWLNGARIRMGQLMVFSEHRELAVRSISPLWQWAVLRVPRATLQAAVFARIGRDIGIAAHGWQPCAPTIDDHIVLRRQVRAALLNASRWNAATPVELACIQGDLLLDAFVDALTGSESEDSTSRAVRRAHGEAMVRRAEAFLKQDPDIDFQSQLLSAALVLGERQTERAFRDAYGMTPCRWQQTARLNQARQLLLHGRGIGVTEAALRLGFTHFGRFSRDYRALFGEQPRTTRDRAVCHTGFHAVPGKCD